jgi:flagellar biosynthesis/type III secretory pathway protein FliH
MSEARASAIRSGTPPLAALLGLGAAAARPTHVHDCAAEIAAAVAVAVAETEAHTAAAAREHWERLLAEREAHWQLQAAASDARAEATVRAAAGQLGDLLLAALRAVLGSEPALPPEAIASLAEEALAAFADHGAGTLRLSPADAARIDLRLPDGWILREDLSVQAGEVHAEVGAGLAMARVEHRLSCLARSLAEGLSE